MLVFKNVVPDSMTQKGILMLNTIPESSLEYWIYSSSAEKKNGDGMFVQASDDSRGDDEEGMAAWHGNLQSGSNKEQLMGHQYTK